MPHIIPQRNHQLIHGHFTLFTSCDVIRVLPNQVVRGKWWLCYPHHLFYFKKKVCFLFCFQITMRKGSSWTSLASEAASFGPSTLRPRPPLPTAYNQTVDLVIGALSEELASLSDERLCPVITAYHSTDNDIAKLPVESIEGYAVVRLPSLIFYPLPL